ncbi:MAG: YraN family protein [Planctomycetes bacterium]|nr:YraN family protein [Planctomycetota bacterium]MBU1519014.1 YraN family protein [Planctomycetota bacterium]MBU2458636.1 YraN family protein [Planctomycetota bacterium]MBU2596543.1 YraN family protein [Planctomycetota bacterium]
MSDAALLGRWGQKQCEKFFKAKGCKTLTKNFSCRTGEIDLIMAASDGTVVFVEVKTRKNENYVDAEAAVTPAKKQRMKKAANLFVKKHKLDNLPLRFDVVVVIPDENGKAQIRHYENAFTP